MTPFASVAMLEKLALLKIARWRAPAFSNTSSACLRRVTSPAISETPIVLESVPIAMALPPIRVRSTVWTTWSSRSVRQRTHRRSAMRTMAHRIWILLRIRSFQEGLMQSTRAYLTDVLIHQGSSLVALCAVGWGTDSDAGKRTVCAITANPPDEKEMFRERLPEDQYEFVELVG